MKSTINLGLDSLELMNARYRHKKWSSERSLVITGNWHGDSGSV